MKVFTLLLVLLALGCEKTQRTETRRHFELHSGTYEDTILNFVGTNMGPPMDTQKRQGVFRIDTETGKTWLYHSGGIVNTNGYDDTECWKEIPETPRGLKK